METPKIAIIGAGPAGIATSIQLSRLGYRPKLFEKEILGGLLWNANLIENYPGFPDGISGPDLINLMEMHLKQLKIEIEQLHINQISFENGCFQLKSDKRIDVSDYVVIASGTKPRPIGINISESVRKKTHHDIKELLNIFGKHIIVIGAGDAAFDYAINLSRKNRVSIINRGSEVRSLQLLVDRALANERITYSNNTEVEGIDLLIGNERKKIYQLQVNCNSINDGKFSIECDEVVFAIGREPQLDFMDRFVENDRSIFAGDVKNGIFRQASIAIGDGIKAAMKIHNHVRRGNK